MILRAIIIDDEPKAISIIEKMIRDHVKDVKVVASSSACDGLELIENYKPEIVFLDINMPEMNGFEFLSRLNFRNFNLIFITAHQEHALKALKNNAVDYILKPVDYEEIQAAVATIRKKIAQQQISDPPEDYARMLNELQFYNRNKLLVSLKSTTEAIDLNELLYLESNSNYTRLHLSSGKIVSTAKTLRDFEIQLCLPGQSFMRIHTSFIINLSRVTRYVKGEECVILNEEHKIPLSKTKKDQFYSWLNR